MSISIGLDLSLQETGYVKLKNGEIIDKFLIKSKPNGKRPVDELERLLRILTRIDDSLKPVDIVVIEGLAYMARNTRSLVQLSGLNYLVRTLLCKNKIPFIIVAPTTLKKFITGKGNIQKDLMLLETYKKYNISFDNNNLCDAYGLAKIGEALLNKKVKLTKIQQEVINKLNEQL